MAKYGKKKDGKHGQPVLTTYPSLLPPLSNLPLCRPSHSLKIPAPEQGGLEAVTMKVLFPGLTHQGQSK